MIAVETGTDLVPLEAVEATLRLHTMTTMNAGALLVDIARAVATTIVDALRRVISTKVATGTAVYLLVVVAHPMSMAHPGHATLKTLTMCAVLHLVATKILTPTAMLDPMMDVRLPLVAVLAALAVVRHSSLNILHEVVTRNNTTLWLKEVSMSN